MCTSSQPSLQTTVPYIRDTINCKLRPDLIWKKKWDWSQFSLKFSKKHSKMLQLVAFTGIHVYMHPKEFNDLFLKSLTERFTKKNNKEVILLGDFNIDLIKSNSNANALEFLDVIYSSNLLPHITSPTHLTSRSHTLIDNIISNINE